VTAPGDGPRIVRSSVEFESHVFDVARAVIRFPDGREVERAVVRHPGAVAMIVVDAEGRWLLVRQYRYPAGRELLEIPAGTREGDDSPEATAARETREETGYRAASMVRIGGSWMVPGYGDEYITYFLATGLTHDPLPPDDDEGLSDPVPMTVDEVEAAIDAGEIQDAKTLAALTLYRRHLARTAG
jgi:ADP-ribose pyrophosphatase